MQAQGTAVKFCGNLAAQRIRDSIYDPDAMVAWEKGDLSGKLRPIQRTMQKAIRYTDALKYVLNCSRRLGKSFLLLTDALETGLREYNAPLKFAAPTQKQMKGILLPLFRIITLDCPPKYKPIYKSSEQRYIFPTTGSDLTISGCNNGHEESLRGTACRKAYVDEAQSFKNLRYVVQDILMPQLLTTNGRMVIAGTPPKTPIHDFVKLIAEARGRGSYAEHDIYAAGYDADLIAKFKEESGGEHSTTWKREYLCQIVMDENYALVPEWRPEFERVPDRDEFLPFYHKYVALDSGVRDKTAVLFGWYDFKRATLFVEDELIINGPQMTTQLLAGEVKKKELDIFGKMGIKLRIADNDNLILLTDLGSLHGLHFAPTNKETLEAMVNQVRLWASAGRIVVHPRCVNLIGCLRYGIWDEKRKAFERYPKDSDAYKIYGHFDALAALIYLVRNVDDRTNPIPPDYKIDRHEMFFRPVGLTDTQRTVKTLFGPKRNMTE